MQGGGETSSKHALDNQSNFKPIYQKCLFAKALPEPVFRYRSNSIALWSSSNLTAVTIFHGLNLDVCEDFLNYVPATAASNLM